MCTKKRDVCQKCTTARYSPYEEIPSYDHQACDFIRTGVLPEGRVSHSESTIKVKRDIWCVSCRSKRDFFRKRDKEHHDKYTETRRQKKKEAKEQKEKNAADAERRDAEHKKIWGVTSAKETEEIVAAQEPRDEDAQKEATKQVKAVPKEQETQPKEQRALAKKEEAEPDRQAKAEWERRGKEEKKSRDEENNLPEQMEKLSVQPTPSASSKHKD
ncbi:Nn.00g103940.m01.CDS01 [Neocucurbitaria sp. VM-36]